MLIVGAALLFALAALLGSASTPPAALAEITPRVGFRATVLGWSSWYGSYDVGPAGTGWCIDHGLRAPDPAFRYRPSVAPDLDDDQRAAMAWAVTAHVDAADPIESAAIMLVLHDLRRASYPFGRLDVDRLTATELAGFGGHEADVVARARAIKAEARAHQHLRGPFSLRVTLAPGADATGLATATITDAAGAPIVGAGLRIDASGAQLSPPASTASGPDGSLAQTYTMGHPAVGATLRAHAIIPDPTLAILASSTIRAQRVARSAWLTLEADAEVAGPPTTTTNVTSTAPGPTTTISTATATTTTTTSTAPGPTTTISTTTTGPPTSSSTTTTTTTTTTDRPSTSTLASTSTSTSTTPGLPAPATEVPPAPPSTAGANHSGRLPVTGGPITEWAIVGLALVVLGASVVGVSRRGAA